MIALRIIRRLWNGHTLPSVTHTLVCGVSRSGKSEVELTRLVSLAKKGECAIVLLDPPGTLAAKFLLHLHALGLDRRVQYDRLADTDRVPGYDWLTPSAHPDLLQREAENDERVGEFAAVLLRRRGIHDPAKTPLIEEGILAALQLYLAQQAPVPLPSLADVFDVGSPARAHLLAHCTEPQLVRKFHEYTCLSPTARRTDTGPAERILRAVLLSPSFRVRSGGETFDLEQFLDKRGILILDGSSQGNLSRDAAAVMMGAITLRVIRHCRTGAKSRVVLVLDEAVTADLIGVYESQALSEAGKWGLEFHILVQNPFSFPSEEIRSNVLQNCWRHEWFRQGNPEAARLAAEDIAIPLLDPLRLHHTESRMRTKDAGYDRIETTSRNSWRDSAGRSQTGVGWQTVLWPRRHEVAEAQARYTALTDQILLMQKELMLLRPGYRFVRGDTVTRRPEYVPMLRHSKLLLERWAEPFRKSAQQDTGNHLAAILRRMKARATYRSAVTGFDPSQRCASPLGAVRRLRAANRQSQGLRGAGAFPPGNEE